MSPEGAVEEQLTEELVKEPAEELDAVAETTDVGNMGDDSMPRGALPPWSGLAKPKPVPRAPFASMSELHLSPAILLVPELVSGVVAHPFAAPVAKAICPLSASSSVSAAMRPQVQELSPGVPAGSFTAQFGSAMLSRSDRGSRSRSREHSTVDVSGVIDPFAECYDVDYFVDPVEVSFDQEDRLPDCSKSDLMQALGSTARPKLDDLEWYASLHDDVGMVRSMIRLLPSIPSFSSLFPTTEKCKYFTSQIEAILIQDLLQVCDKGVRVNFSRKAFGILTFACASCVPRVSFPCPALVAAIVNVDEEQAKMEFGRNPPTHRPVVKSYPLEDSQFRAMSAASVRTATLIRGPPGTGKTQVSVALLQFWSRASCSLGVCDSNGVVNDMTAGLISQGMRAGSDVIRGPASQEKLDAKIMLAVLSNVLSRKQQQLRGAKVYDIPTYTYARPSRPDRADRTDRADRADQADRADRRVDRPNRPSLPNQQSEPKSTERPSRSNQTKATKPT